MTDSKDEARLYGWDDGKIYFSDGPTRTEICVNEEPELLARLVEVCREWYGEGDRRVVLGEGNTQANV